MALGGEYSTKHFDFIAIKYQNIYFVIWKNDVRAIEITQVHSMTSAVGIIQKHLIIVLIKYHFGVKQDVYQSTEYGTGYLIVIIMKKSGILIIHVHKFNVIVYNANHPN